MVIYTHLLRWFLFSFRYTSDIFSLKVSWDGTCLYFFLVTAQMLLFGTQDSD